MAMQDIRLRLEPQHSTVAFSSSSSSPVASSSTSTSPTPATVETTLIETGETIASPASLSRPQLLPELSFSATTTTATTVVNTAPQQQHNYYHHHHHHPHHPHSHSHPAPPRAQPRHHVEQLQLLHSHHSHSHATEQQHQQQQQLPRSPSSEEDNSPTEMNNCRRLVDKPPLVKRLTMGIGLLRGTEDSRPLMHNTCSSSLNSGSSQTISDGYVNEAICEPDKYVASKFGDSCRQSLTALETATQRLQAELPNSKKYLRETCSANSSPKLFANGSSRLDNLSLAEQQELKGAAWYQAGIPREISLEVLSRQSPGAFLVRQSSTKPGCFALSLRVPPPSPRVAHYLILRTPRGYKIKGFTKEFSSLRALITHHSVMPELLPVPLTLPRPAHVRAQAQQYGNGGGDFEMYGSLNDFRKMMADLNV